MSELEQFLRERELNAALSWLIAVFLVAVMIHNLLAFDLLWAGFVWFVIAVILLPAAAYRNPTVMPPVEVLFLAALPAVGNTFPQMTGADLLTSTVVTYLAVAAVALLVTVELHTFTAVKMTHRFAIMFVVITTMAVAGVWSVFQWLSDIYLGTRFLINNTTLMHGFILATGAGLVGGLVFDIYFRRRRDRRLQELYETDLELDLGERENR